MSRPDNTQPLTVMGLMSGTSVDAVDACLARLTFLNGQLNYDIIATHSCDMPDDLRQQLLTCMTEKTAPLETLCQLNVAVGELFAETALGLMRAHKIKPGQIDCIGSHGQTIYHWPPSASDKSAGKLGGTLQIGESSIIAEKTGVYTIADFRPRDMAAGGQGAPLVCFADLLLFQDDTRGRCIQNIGGIANVTVVPSKQAQSDKNLPVIAFDTGPGNMLIDAAMQRFFDRAYDANGDIARGGKINTTVLQALMAHPYLKQPPPKTTGRELFGVPFLEVLLRDHPDVAPADWVATLTRFTAASIVDAYERFVFPAYDISDVVIGGGGVKNRFLMETLQQLFAEKNRTIVLKTHADFGIPDQYKEALAFAILAWAAMLNRPNNIPACTGASHPVVMGKHIR